EATDFLQAVRATMSRFRSVSVPNLPPFTGGAVGYFGYDMVRTIEDLPAAAVDDLIIDDAVLMFFKTVLAFDHLRHQIHIISNLLVEESADRIEQQYESAVAKIAEIESLIVRPRELSAIPKASTESTGHSNFENGLYLK